MTDDKKKVLVVEDDANLRKILTSKLSASEFDVLEGENGEEGLARAKESHPDIILLDLRMPKMDGVTMLQFLRQDEWGKTATVVVLTNFNDEENIAATQKFNVRDFWVKADMSVMTIVEKVKSILSK